MSILLNESGPSVPLDSSLTLLAHAIANDGTVRVQGEPETTFYGDYLNYETRGGNTTLAEMFDTVTIVAHDILNKTDFHDSMVTCSLIEWLQVKYLLEGYFNGQLKDQTSII